jgi:hypothetical protein
VLDIEKKLDKKFQELSKGKKCYYCNRKATEIHHLERRSNLCHRWDRKNALPICRKHHFDIHSNGLKEPELTFKREDIREYLVKNFICYRQFLEIKAKEYGIKWTEKDFEKVRSSSSTPRQKAVVKKFFITEKAKEYLHKMRKEAYQKRKEWLKNV